MKKKILSNKFILYISSFIIPFLLAAFSYYQQGIYPTGPNTVLLYDMRGELLPLYGYLFHMGPGYDNLLHWMSGGLGGGFIGTAAMYLSFFDIIFRFVPISVLPTAIYFLLLVKIGLCGLAFTFFISKTFDDRLSPLWSIVFSCCYSLMSYVFAFSVLLIWLDGVMLLPILALLAEKIIENKKSFLFVLVLTICIIDDYYIAFMIIIALTFYFIFKLIEKEYDLKTSVNRMISYIIHGVLSAGLSSFILIPVVCDLRRGKLSEDIGLSDGLLIKNGIGSVLKMFFPSNYANLGSNQPPYIFCGSVIFILCLVWLLVGKKSLKARLASAIIIFIYLCSFIIGPVDRVWHGFRDPIGFSCRYSFTFVFFLICFAIRGLERIRNINIKLSSGMKKLIPVIVALYTLVELNMNSSYVLSKLMEDYMFANREEYERICDVMETSLASVDADQSSGYGRLVKNFNYSCSDGALYGYDGLEMFTSSYNSALIDFLHSLGLNATNNYIKEPGLTPPLANILNVKYYMSYWFDVSDYYSPVLLYKSHGIYENVNAMPFAYSISDDYFADAHAFGTDPFENINMVYSDIFGYDHAANVFRDTDYDYIEGSDPNCTYICFVPFETGHYWIYPEFDLVSEADANREYLPSDLSYLTYSVNDVALGQCGFYNFRYCGDLGMLQEGEEYVVSFSAPVSVVGNIDLVYYDSRLCEKLVADVSGLGISRIDSDGICLSGTMDSDSDVMITLPFDKSYRVYVNGIKTSPKPYRDSLMVIHLEAGENEVRIKYVPDGLYCGIALTVLFSIVTVLLFRRKNNL